MQDETSADFFKLQEKLAGRYSLEKELGRGGMGIVYLAREVNLDRPVALKLLPPTLAARPTARERFLHEARIAAKLSHPNIVPIFAVDEVDEFVFFAMAYIEGESLGERVRTRGPRAPSEVARILREVAWALAYAHAQGVIHRDVKPDNILLESGSGRALVADFGIASVAENTPAGEQVVAGTAEFMSPEQARGGQLGPASDAYSLGVVGYYALSGKFPFEGSTPSVILAKHLSEPPLPVTALVPAVPGKLARAIDRCLAKDPAERYPNDEQLAEALGQVVERRRDLPVPLRVFIKRTGGVGVGGAVLYVWLLTMVSSMAAVIAPSGLEGIAGLVTFIAGLTVVPGGILIKRVRRLLESGYGQQEVGAALREESARTLEEGTFQFGHAPSVYEWVVRFLSIGSLSVAAISIVALILFGPGTGALPPILASSLMLGLSTGTLAVLRLQRRRDVEGQIRTWFWESRLGRWLFRVAGIGLKKLPEAASGTHRPTEMAIGLAADRLYEELPRTLRRSLRDLPSVVRELESDAQKMRNRIERLDATLAEIRGDRSESRSLEAAMAPGEHLSVAEQRRKLEQDLQAARDATQQRLADAVAALETIRLGLLRMQAGSGSVESLTGDLAAARDVAGEIDRLLEAQLEVERLLGSKER